ncbi:hypothetical protein [Halobacterium yunchengense]|uniref:hypothetical protein n=1 Tax=Halobacterium yunchengense TaxID=3108497 RepID=UPI00300B24B7
MMSDGDYCFEGVGPRIERTDQIADPQWAVVKSLLEVNSACTNTLEDFLLYSSTGRLEDLPAEELTARIDELAERQRRTLEELELAKEALRELDDR